MTEVGAWAVVVGAGAAVTTVFYLWERARTKAFLAAGAALGLRPLDKGLEGLPPELRALPLFKEGHSGWAENVLWPVDRDYVVFEYCYTEGSGKHKTTYTQTVGALLCRGKALPAFTAWPEGILDWISERIGGQDIDFPQDPAFAKAYRLRGDDEGAVRDFFSVGGTQFLAARPGWTVQAQGDWLLAYRKNKRVSPKGLRDFVWDLQGLYGALFGV